MKIPFPAANDHNLRNSAHEVHFHEAFHASRKELQSMWRKQFAFWRASSAEGFSS
jgi:hypothetical protein